MITLYPHQNDFVRDIRVALRTNQSVLARASTGFGKTVIASYMAKSATEKNKRVIFTVHRKELIAQTAKTFDKFGIDYGIICAGMRADPFANVQIASIDTLKRRLDRDYRCDILINDESHLAMSVGWAKVINHFKDKGAFVVGLSGSPCRLDGKGLGDLFDVMVPGVSMSWLIENKYLSEYKLMSAPVAPDLTGVHKSMGDYKKDEAAHAMDTNAIFGSVLDQYKKHAYGKRTICFCVTVAHSKHVAKQFNANGIPAAHIDGTTPQIERKRVINQFANGEIWVLCNVELVTTGFDLSAQVDRDVPVEAIIQLRPTQSLALYLQMVGRGLRYKLDPAVILDHALNWMRHGFPDDDREWSLEGEKRTTGKKSADDIEVKIKQCDKCFHVHTPAPKCPECGNVYQVVVRGINEVEGELVEIDRNKEKRQRMKEQGAARSIGDLVKLGYARGYKSPHTWAAHIWTSRESKKRGRSA